MVGVYKFERLSTEELIIIYKAINFADDQFSGEEKILKNIFAKCVLDELSRRGVSQDLLGGEL